MKSETNRALVAKKKELHNPIPLGLPRRWKVITSTILLLFTMGIGQMWGAVTVETYNNTGAASNTAIVKTGSTLPGNYDAGTASKPQGHSESGGVKLRTQNTKVTLDEVEYGYAVITANAGYSLKSFQLDATSNSTNSITLYGVYVDVDATNASTLATAIGTATNKLSSNVVFPNKTTDYVSTPNLSINASSNIVMIFSGSGDNQLRAVIKVGYEKLTYAVTYLPGENGTGSVDAQVKTYGENLTLSSATFSRDNYTQAGWSLTDGGEKAYELGGTYTGNAALTLYPYWVSSGATSHSISYEELKGSDISSYPTSFYEGVGVASFDPLADITGWHFTGWSPSSIGAEATTDQTITAQWTPVYAVSFNLQDHGSAIDPQNVISGQKASEPEEPEANGWGFGGWYKEAACTNAWDFSTETVTEATELFAKWTEFDCSGTGTMFSISSLSGTQKVAKTTDANNPTWMNLSTYGTITGGKAKAGNKDTSNDRGGVNTGRIAWDSGNAILWLHFNCPIATGDKMIVTGFDPDGGALYVRKAYSTTTDQLNIDKDHTEITFPAAFDGLYDIYLWRNGGTTTYLTGITVTRTSCDKPSTPTVTVNDKTYKSATIVLDGGTTMPTGTVGYKVYVEKTSDHTVIRDWVDCATQEYALTGLEAETTYTVKAKAVGGEGKCALGDESDGVDFATLVKTCPTSGVMFSMALKSGASTRSLNSGASYDLTSSDVTIEGGSASIKNIDPDNNGKMKISSGPKFDFQGNKAYVKIVLDCPLQAGDKIEIAGGSGKQIAITPTEGIPADASVKVTTSSYNYTVTAADVTAGFAGPTILTYYLGRADASSTQITGLTITRPYAITFANGGHGTAPSETTGFEVALTQITGVDGWVHTGWTANKVVKVGGSDVAIGTAMAVDATATVSANTTFTAVWEEEVPTYSVTYKANNGTAEADVEHATESTFAANMFTAPEGKIFNGWNTSATGEGASYAVGAAVTAATTVYAQWIIDPTIRLIKADGSLNIVDFASVGGTLKDDKAYAVDGRDFAKYVLLSGTYTSDIVGNTMQTKYIIYDTQSDQTDITLYLYNTNNNAKNLYYQIIKDGAAVGEKQSVSITSKENGQTVVIPTIEHTKKTRIVFCVESTNILFCQIEVLENGTALAGFGENGYQLSIPGRPASTSKLTNIDGFEIKSYNDLKMGSGTDYLALRGVDGSTYVTFTTASNIQLQVTTANANKFYVCAANIGTSSDKQYGGEAGTHNVNLLAGTYYIVPTAGSSGGEVRITKLAFATAPATVTVTFNSNEGSAVAAQELFSGDKAVEPTAPTKSGYRFVEWQLSGSAYDFDDAVTTDIELDAVWQKTWTVTFNSNGGSDVDAAVVDNGATVAAPDPAPTKGGYDFVEWRKEGEDVAYDFATAVNANITLVAQWEVAQDDASLSALSYNSNAIDVNSAVEVAGVQTYTYHLQYGSSIDPALISVTKNAESANMSVIAYDSENKQATFMVTSGNGLVSINYAIQFVIDPKRGTSIIKATTNNVVTGLIGGTIDQSYSGNANSRKLNKGNYFGVTLANDETFQEGDVFIVNITTPADLGKFMIYADKNRTELVADQGIVYTKPNVENPVICPTGEMMLVLPAAANGKKSLYLSRENVDNSEQWNVTFSYIEVTREMNPAIKSFKFGDDAATINEGAKTITIEMPYSTDVTALTPTVEAYGNNGATYTPSGAQDFTSPVNYVVTDAYSEFSTTYAVTVTKAAASTNADLASLAVAGYSLDFDPATTSYNIVLDYGTTVLPAITYEVAEVGLATAEKVEGSVNSATTITVTPEAGAGYEKVYTINFSVSTNPKYVIYDGSTMTNIASATGADGSTGFSYSMASNIPLSGDAISSSWGGKDYTHVIKNFKPTDNVNNIVSFVIPEGYVAKVRLVGTTNSTGTERKLFIAMSASKDAADALDNYIITSSTYDAQGFVTDYLLPNTYYLGSTDSYRLFEFSIQLYPIDYSRNVTEGRFGTICLPNGGVLLGADLYEVAYYGETSKKIFFDEILSGVMEAGVPYVFLPQEGVNKLAVVYTDDADAAATNRNGLVGFIGADEDDETSVPAGMYILQNNQYRLVSAGADARIKSYRAYINLGAITPTAPALAPGRRRISMGVASENSATGMDELNASETPVKMMIDGQLYILRGEKLYDATGRLVK